MPFPRPRRYLPIAGAEHDPLRVETEERPEGIVAHVSGEVDLANAARLKATLQPAVAGGRSVIVDMSNLRYIDTSGWNVLIDTQKVLRQHNCQLVIAGASHGIVRVMSILHLDDLMASVPSIDEAIDLIRTEPSSAASSE